MITKTLAMAIITVMIMIENDDNNDSSFIQPSVC